MKTKIFSILICIFILSCTQNKADISKTNSMTTDSLTLRNENYYSSKCIPLSSFPKDFQEEISIHKKLQDSIDVENVNNQYKMTEKDIEIASKMIYECLVKNGFKPISYTEYENIISEYFHINLEKNDLQIVKHPNFSTYILNTGSNDMASLNQFEYDYTYENVFFLSNYRIITYLPLIGDFLQNPHYEENISTDTKICIPDKIIHRNKYLFNDNKSSLAWLLKNDQEFLEILVREFGYDKEFLINKLILNKASKEYYSTQPPKDETLNNLFVKRKNDGSLDIRNGLFESIIENTATDNKELYDMATNNVLVLIMERTNSNIKLTIQEKAKLLANFASMEAKLYDLYYKSSLWNYHTTTYDILNNLSEDYRQIWKENNYYNIPQFNEVLKSLDAENEPLS